MELETLLQIVRENWDSRYIRGRILQVYKPKHELPDGTTINLSLTIQTVSEARGVLHDSPNV